jgi:hypothetical protein
MEGIGLPVGILYTKLGSLWVVFVELLSFNIGGSEDIILMIHSCCY